MRQERSAVVQWRDLQLESLEQRHGTRGVRGTYLLINSGIAIAVMAGLAMATKQPFAFPSLGPTAFLVFYQPLAANAAPRSAFFGHLIGVCAGYLGLVIFGLTRCPRIWRPSIWLVWAAWPSPWR